MSVKAWPLPTDYNSAICSSPNPMQLLAVGLNHTTAPLSLREKVAFPADQISEAVASARAWFAIPLLYANLLIPLLISLWLLWRESSTSWRRRTFAPLPAE